MAKFLSILRLEALESLQHDPELVEMIESLFQGDVNDDAPHPAPETPPAADPETGPRITPPPPLLPSRPGDD